jgi:cell division protein FtsB
MTKKHIINVKKIDFLKLSFKLSALSLFISLFAQIYISNSVAIKSDELMRYQEQKNELERKISKLEYEDSQLSSLAYLETRAKELGFVKFSDNVLAIKDPSTASILPGY